jgi:translation initiation factor IF-2
VDLGNAQHWLREVEQELDLFERRLEVLQEHVRRLRGVEQALRLLLSSPGLTERAAERVQAERAVTGRSAEIAAPDAGHTARQPTSTAAVGEPDTAAGPANAAERGVPAAPAEDAQPEDQPTSDATDDAVDEEATVEEEEPAAAAAGRPGVTRPMQPFARRAPVGGAGRGPYGGGAGTQRGPAEGGYGGPASGTRPTRPDFPTPPRPGSPTPQEPTDTAGEAWGGNGNR